MSAMAQPVIHEHAYMNVGEADFVTATIDNQLFGISVSAIRDVFTLKALTPVPGAKPEIAGVLNLRGRIVTAIDARRKLGLAPRVNGFEGVMAIGVEHCGEAYCILVDHVGDVVRLGQADILPNPTNLQTNWKTISQGVYRLDGKLMIIINVETFLSRISISEQGH
jgi:purine-binding chemotaxis protein CheW